MLGRLFLKYTGICKLDCEDGRHMNRQMHTHIYTFSPSGRKRERLGEGKRIKEEKSLKSVKAFMTNVCYLLFIVLKAMVIVYESLQIILFLQRV